MVNQDVVKHYFNWTEYYALVQELAHKIYDDKKGHMEFDQILCLARGGTPLGDALSRMFNLPLAILFTSSYKMTSKQQGIFIDNQIAKQNNRLGENILLVDDLVDSGETLEAVANYMKNNHKTQSGENIQITTAVLWKKDTSIFTPNYYAKETTQNDWIVQPFECFDDFKF
jgi:hypoxanthine phosphoribosyltransferase